MSSTDKNFPAQSLADFNETDAAQIWNKLDGIINVFENSSINVNVINPNIIGGSETSVGAVSGNTIMFSFPNLTNSVSQFIQPIEIEVTFIEFAYSDDLGGSFIELCILLRAGLQKLSTIYKTIITTEQKVFYGNTITSNSGNSSFLSQNATSIKFIVSGDETQAFIINLTTFGSAIFTGVQPTMVINWRGVVNK